MDYLTKEQVEQNKKERNHQIMMIWLNIMVSFKNIFIYNIFSFQVKCIMCVSIKIS